MGLMRDITIRRRQDGGGLGCKSKPRLDDDPAGNSNLCKDRSSRSYRVRGISVSGGHALLGDMKQGEDIGMLHVDRRSFLALAGAQLALRGAQAANTPAAPQIGFGFGTYGMKDLATPEAMRVCAEIGYDGIELALMDGWLTEPTLLSQTDRVELRRRLLDLELAVPSLLESLPCLRTDEKHRDNLERLKRAAQLAHDLSPDKPPVVQSIVGGKTARWPEDKLRLVQQLADWAKVGETTKTVICFKPHAAHIVHDVDRALWIHRQVNSRWLKVVYDYSHFYLEGFALADSLKQLLPITPYIQVKDSRGTPQKHEYLLPGDGETDYRELLTVLKEADYNGFVNVEVSAMIHRKPGYEPIPTARLCYQRLAPLFDQIGIRRP